MVRPAPGEETQLQGRATATSGAVASFRAALPGLLRPDQTLLHFLSNPLCSPRSSLHGRTLGFPVFLPRLLFQRGYKQTRSILSKRFQPQNFLSNRVSPLLRCGRLPPASGPSNCQAGAPARRALTPKQSGDRAAHEDPEGKAQKQPPQAPRQTGSHRGAGSAREGGAGLGRQREAAAGLGTSCAAPRLGTAGDSLNTALRRCRGNRKS